MSQYDDADLISEECPGCGRLMVDCVCVIPFDQDIEDAAYGDGDDDY